ncbi:hypothetical protein L7F22_030391 [Adiantum nelumboides]|nr:hypothetical protein [Adiantum nelumboides]
MAHRMAGRDQEEVKLRAFPLVFKGEVRVWYDSLAPPSKATWPTLYGAFLNKNMGPVTEVRPPPPTNNGGETIPPLPDPTVHVVEVANTSHKNERVIEINGVKRDQGEGKMHDEDQPESSKKKTKEERVKMRGRRRIHLQDFPLGHGLEPYNLIEDMQGKGPHISWPQFLAICPQMKKELARADWEIERLICRNANHKRIVYNRKEQRQEDIQVESAPSDTKEEFSTTASEEEDSDITTEEDSSMEVMGSRLRPVNKKQASQVEEEVKEQLQESNEEMIEYEVILLGHKISQQGIEVDPSKAKALLELPFPKSIKEVTSFMQKVKYMARFIHLASKLLHPLQKTTQQVEFAWSKDLEEYFKSIKMVLFELPTLMPPCWDFSFFVNSSVGAESIGAILLQQDPQSSRMRPVYFTSRVTTNIEKGYSEGELMMLSLIFAVRKFRSYLLTKLFVIFTSENLLPWVSSQMTMSPRISKWLMELQSYEYTFKVENSVRAQLVGILTYRLHEKLIKVPDVKPLPPPPPKVLSNVYTLFFDGAFRRAKGKARGGLVLVNPKGEVVMKEQVTLDGSTSNNEAEYDVLISGLKICLAQKIQRLMVKGDALLIVKQILGIWACKNERLRTKVTSIRKLFSQFEEVQLYHIPRKVNEGADL